MGLPKQVHQSLSVVVEVILPALQWLAFVATNTIVLPMLLAGPLHLNAGELTGLIARSLVVAGLFSLLQLRWGHRLPINEGPAGASFGTFVALAQVAADVGIAPNSLRGQLGLGVMASGAVMVLFGAMKWTSLLARVFTPTAMGAFSLLLAIQLGIPFVRGILGVGYRQAGVDLPVAVTSAAVAALVWFLSGWGRGLWRGLALLIGLITGWIAFLGLGLTVPSQVHPAGVLAVPAPFAWGPLRFDPGAVAVSVMATVPLIVNLTTSIRSMADVLHEPLAPNQLNRGTIVTGVGNIAAGVAATIGVTPYYTASAFVELTGNPGRSPLLVASTLVLLAGLVPSFAAIWTSLPLPIAYAALFPSFVQMAAMGIRQYAALELDRNQGLIIGAALLAGTGAMSLTDRDLNTLPVLVRQFLANGAVFGIVLAILLEQVVGYVAPRFAQSRHGSAPAVPVRRIGADQRRPGGDSAGCG